MRAHVLSILARRPRHAEEVAEAVAYHRDRGKPMGGMRSRRRATADAEVAGTLRLLVDEGRVAMDGDGNCRLVLSASIRAARESKVDGTGAYAELRCSEIFGDAGVSARAAGILKALRAIGRFHVIRHSDGTAVVAVTSYEVDGGWAYATGAAAVVVEPRSLRIVRLGRGHMDIRASLESGAVGAAMIDAAAGEPVPDAIGSWPLIGWNDAKRGLPKGFEGAHMACRTVRRDLFESCLGTAVTDAQWAAFSKTLKAAVPNRGDMLRRIVVRNLDPEARRAALRNPGADLDLYRWYCGPDERRGLWRRQASAAWPILSGRLRSLEATIDAGGPLSAALGTELGLPASAVADLRGLTWQRAGGNLLADLGDHDSSFLRMLRHLPPEVGMDAFLTAATLAHPYNGVHTNRWSERMLRALHVSRELVDLCEHSEAFRRMAARDLVKALSVVRDPTAMDGVDRVVESYLSLLCPVDEDGFVRGCCPSREGVAALMLDAAAGPEGSFKRLRKQSERFHRNQRSVDAALQAMEDALPPLGKSASRSALPKWSPTPGRWECTEGSIEWLTTAKALRKEGAAQSHCVGSYYPEVASGVSAIGRVVAADGGRSTVELSIRRKGFTVRQNQGARNRGLPDGCVDVVTRFLQAVEAGEVMPDWDTHASMAKAASRRGRGRTPFSRVAAQEEEAFVAALGPILPPSLAAMPPGELAELVRARC